MRSTISTKNPRCGEVYNLGGSRHSHCSMLEAISICEELAEKTLEYTYTENNRSGIIFGTFQM